MLLVLGMLLTGLCSCYWQLVLTQGILVGFGSGCLFLPSIAVLPQYFEKRRALATGIGSSGSAIGERYYHTRLGYTDVILGGICFPILFNHVQPKIGFRYATWSIALIMLVTLAIPISVTRMRLKPDKIRRLFDQRALRERPFVIWAAYLFVSLLGLYLPSFFVQLYGVRFMNAELAFYLLPVLNAGSFFGRIVGSLLLRMAEQLECN